MDSDEIPVFGAIVKTFIFGLAPHPQHGFVRTPAVGFTIFDRKAVF
jgi:hypothetical protein